MKGPGQDTRPAKGKLQNHLMLPYKLNSEVQTIEICYAPVQWSWAYISLMGGMDSADPRLAKHVKKRVDKIQGENSEEQGLRAHRMQKVDLSCYEDSAQRFSGKDNIAPLDDHPADASGSLNQPDTDFLKAWRGKGMPVVYLFDPVHVALDLADCVFFAQSDLQDVELEAMTKQKDNGAMYNMAKLVHQLIHQDEDLADHVDVELVENELLWGEKEEVLNNLIDACNNLGSYLPRDDFNEGYKGIDLLTVMRDYWEHDGEQWLVGLEMMCTFLEALSAVPGVKHIQYLFDKDHPIIHPWIEPPSTKDKILAGKDGINTLAKLIESLAGASAIDKKVYDSVFKLTKHVISVISDGDLTLSKVDVNVVELFALNQEQAPIAQPNTIRLNTQSARVGKITTQMWVATTASASTTERKVEVPFNKPVVWLKKHEPLIKIKAFKLFVAIELLNFSNATYAYHTAGKKTKDAYAQYSSFFGLLSLGLHYQRSIRNLWGNADTLPKLQQNATRAKRLFLTGFTHGFSIIGNTLGVVAGGYEIIDQWKKGHTDGAVIAGIGVMGSTTLLVAAIMEGTADIVAEKGKRIGQGLAARSMQRVAAVATARISLARFGLAATMPRMALFNWIGLGLTILSVIFAILFYKSNLEKWLLHGPFGKNKDKRFLKESDGGEKEWADWSDPEEAEKTLLNILLGYQLEYRQFHTGSRINKKTREEEYLSDLEVTIKFPLQYDTSLFRFELLGKKRIIMTEKYAWYRTAPVSSTTQPDDDGILTTTLLYKDIAVSEYRFYSQLDLHGDGKKVIPAITKQLARQKVKIDNHSYNHATAIRLVDSQGMSQIPNAEG